MAGLAEEQRPATATPAAPPALDPLRWKALGVVLVASFMILVDISIVNVAIPHIQASIGVTYSQIEWVIAGYALSYAVTLITGGRLGDIFGRKRLFIIGVSGFTAASAACGLAQSGPVLIGARVVQGFFAALMYPQVFSVVQVSFPPQERGKAFGIAGAVIGIASITGPLAGGLLIQGDILGTDWRPIFLVNVPLGIGAVIAAVFLLHESRAPHALRLDIPGTVIATIALFLLAYPLVEGRDAGWPMWIFSMFGIAAVLLVIWFVYNRRRARTVGSPLVEPALFTDRSFVVGLLVVFVFISGVPAFFLTFSIFLQVGHGFSALETGLTTLPFAIASALASGFSIRLAPRIGKWILSVGAVLIVTGMAGVLLTVHFISSGALAGGEFRGYDLIPALFVAGLGMGCTVAPLFNIILAGIHHGNAGSASGVMTTVQQVGGAIGVAVVGVIFFGLLSSHVTTLTADTAPALQQRLVAAGLPGGQAAVAVAGFDRCFSDRAASSDPSATPPSCAALQSHSAQASPAITAVFESERTSLLAADFTYAFERSLIYNLSAWSLVFLLVFLLPRPQHLRRPAPAAALAE